MAVEQEEMSSQTSGGSRPTPDASKEASQFDEQFQGLPEVQTTSGIVIKPLYTPKDVESLDYEEYLGFPGQYPFTRGVYPTMYRGQLWTIRQLGGMGSPRETNRRLQYLLAQGAAGLNICLDMATIMGYDSDDPLAAGEVGKAGVAIDSLRDMETVLDGIPLDEIGTSIVTNAQASVILAMYLVVAEKQGVPWDRLRGTIQNDLLKEYFAQNSYYFPPGDSIRVMMDIIEFCTERVPNWNTVSISGYHIREAGATAVQELAFTLADGMTYVESAIGRGIDVDRFAPRLSFFFCVYNNFFEEIAKFRAARRLWARIMHDRFGAKDPRSWKLRFHAQTSGASLTARQPENNIVRTTIQALASVLGGVQSLHTNAFDEALSLPTEKAATIALRTQQIIGHESGVTDTIDPLGGSYFLETLTSAMENEALRYIERIEALGGVLSAIDKGFLQTEIANAASRYQAEIERGERVIVGLNAFVQPGEEKKARVLTIDPRVEEEKKKDLQRLRAERDNLLVETRLAAIERAARSEENLMPRIVDAVRAYATLGEIIGVMRKAFGEHKELIVI